MRAVLHCLTLPLALASCGPAVTNRVADNPSPFVPLTWAAPPGSASPNLRSDHDGNAYLSWLEKQPNGSHQLRFSVLRDGVFGAPQTILQSDQLFANWADFPSIHPLGNGQLVAHFLEKRPGGKYAYDARYVRSDDLGATWSTSATLHDDGTATEHGFVSLVRAPEGGAAAIWLDGRKMAGGDEQGDSAGHDGHDGHGAGAMTLRYARILADGSLTDSVELDERVCDCCGTTAVPVPGGVSVFYRDRSDNEMRDIARVRIGPAG